jgi:Carboxypeptidase regulatory-like domain
VIRLTLLVSFLLWVLCASTQQARLHEKAALCGTVTDVHGAWITHAQVVFRSLSSRYLTETNEKGSYSIFLPPDGYMISVRRYGFCEVRRGEFVAAPDSQINFDFQLWVCPTDSYGRYNYIELTGASDRGLKPLVLYGKTSTAGDAVTFSGPDFSGGTTPDHPAVLTFNRFTFIANRFSYN